MSRKRPHNEEDLLDENSVYLLPGCYTICPYQQQLIHQEFYNIVQQVYMEEHYFTGDGLYVADAYGNIFYSNIGFVSYVCCNDIVRDAEAHLDPTDDCSDPEVDHESKKTRFTVSSDDDEEVGESKQIEDTPYIVEEPPSEDEGTSK